MARVYFERRISSARGTDSVAADIMRHLHARQHLGKVTIVCEQPIIMLSASRKQWMKLTRHVQKQRASTLNADKILKYTHTITRMQHMAFTMKSSQDYPNADVFFIAPEKLAQVQHYSQTIYTIVSLRDKDAQSLVDHMSEDGLVVDYDHGVDWRALGLLPKKKLEEEVGLQWERVKELLAQYNINPDTLSKGGLHDIDAMDDALDILLNATRTFMQAAGDFQHALEIARPLRTTKDLRQQYDAVVLLAHRVQALGTNTFTQRFLEIYNEDDTFYLYDNPNLALLREYETLQMAIIRHRAAQRERLAFALTNATILPWQSKSKWAAL